MNLKIWLQRNKSVLLFAALLCYLYFRGIGDHGLIDPLEGLNASISLHMSATGNYFEPHLGSSLAAGKSLGFWWLNSLALKIFGWGEFSVRFFSALSGLGMILISAFAAKRFSGDNNRKSWLGASIAASMTICFVVAQIASSNAVYAFLMSLVMFGIIKSRFKKDWLILSHASLVLSFIIHGYDGIILTPLAIYIFCYALNDYELLEDFLTYPYAVIISVLGLGTYILILIAVNPLILHFMRCDILGLSTGNFFTATAFLFLSFLPWQGFLIRAFWEIIRDSKEFFIFRNDSDEPKFKYYFEKKLDDDNENFEKRVFYQRFFMMIWSLIFGIFAILTGNFLSLAVCVVPFSGILGDVLDSWLNRKKFLSVAISIIINIPMIILTVFLIVPLGIVILPVLRASLISLIPWSFLMLLLSIAAWYYARTKQILKWSRNVLGIALFSLMPLAGIFNLISESASIRTSGLELRKIIQKDDLIIQYWENHPSMYFYTYRDSLFINAPLIGGVEQKKFVTNEQTLNALWRGKFRVFLLLPSDRPPEKALPANIFHITESENNLLLSNK